MTDQDHSSIARLLDDGMLDAELAALLWLLVEVRTPVVAVGADDGVTAALIDGLASLLPSDARTVEVSATDTFEWLAEAVELGWRRERTSGAPSADGRLSSAHGVLVVHGLASPHGVAGERARIVVRALALGYGLLATMRGDGLDGALAGLNEPGVGTDQDERSRLGIVLAVGSEEGRPRITAAHYVRPVAFDTRGHVQRLPPAVLATWNPAAGRWDHFAWGVLADLAGRTGITPVAFEREQARRSSSLSAVARAPVHQQPEMPPSGH